MVKIVISNKYIEKAVKALDSEHINIIDMTGNVQEGKTYITLEQYPTDTAIAKKLQCTDWESYEE